MLEGEALVLVGNPALNALIWAVLVVGFGYFARRQSHRLIRGLFSGVRRFCRMLARYCVHAERHVRAWTRSLLVAQARRRVVERAEWDMGRLHADIQAELGDLPALQQQARDHLSMVEEDHRRSGPMPPDVPGWPRMLEQLGPELGAADPSVKRTLEDLRDGLELQRVDLLDAYRRATRRRYLLLHRTIPHWRRARRALEQMGDRVDRLRARTDRVLNSIGEYQALRDEHQVRVGALVGASLWRFVLAGVGLVLATAGFTVLGVSLVEPMNLLLGTVPAAEGLPGQGTLVTVLYVAAVGLIGLVVMESARMTTLLPGVDALGDSMCGWLFWVAFAALVVLAGAGALLRLQYGGMLPSALDSPWSATAAPALQAVLVFLLPFALMFGAVALAGIIIHGGIVVGLLVALVLQILMLVFRLLGSMAAFAGAIVVQLYDLVIFLPLWIEEAVRQKGWPSGGVAPSRRQLPSPPGDRPSHG